MVVDGPNKANDDRLEEKSAAPMEAINQVLAMLGDLSEQMNRMEVFQKEQGGKDRQGSPESIFGSALGERAGMTLQALKRTPPPKKSPNVSPATYFGERHHIHANGDGRPVNPIVTDFNMGPAPGLAHPRQEMPAGYHPSVGMPNGMYPHPGQQAAGMPDARHRKLAIQPFDGKELYHGLGSGFLE